MRQRWLRLQNGNPCNGKFSLETEKKKNNRPPADGYFRSRGFLCLQEILLSQRTVMRYTGDMAGTDVPKRRAEYEKERQA